MDTVSDPNIVEMIGILRESCYLGAKIYPFLSGLCLVRAIAMII